MAEREHEADVCLILEGTYPYVSGGVSTWVHQIITQLSELKFSIVYIAFERDERASYSYELPGNVTGVHELYLSGGAGKTKRSLNERQIAALGDSIGLLLESKQSSEQEFAHCSDIAEKIGSLAARGNIDDVWAEPETFDLLSDLFSEHFSDESFLEFFWSAKFLVEPVWNLLKEIDRIPSAPVYHSLCTGYAGAIGATISRRRNAPFVLSEHGIYVRERVAEIQQARWIREDVVLRPGQLQAPSALRRMWMEFFKLLGRYTYAASDQITSLFEKNASIQVHYGADAKRIEITPNGVSVDGYDKLLNERVEIRASGAASEIVGFLGRVVSIKDVKTLLRAARHALDARPQLKFLIAGPTDEEPAYFRECGQMAERLGLNDRVQFLGVQQRQEILPAMDVMVLTSVSEGLPFVILEAFAAGIPVVSTDVGACRELIEGAASESPALGFAGRVTPVGDPEATASAIVELFGTPELIETLGATGRARVETYYREQAVVDTYRELYGLREKLQSAKEEATV